MDDKRKFKPNANLKLMDQIREVLRYYHYAYQAGVFVRAVSEGRTPIGGARLKYRCVVTLHCNIKYHKKIAFVY